jgi:hypothetical protein
MLIIFAILQAIGMVIIAIREIMLGNITASLGWWCALIWLGISVRFMLNQ